MNSSLYHAGNLKSPRIIVCCLHDSLMTSVADKRYRIAFAPQIQANAMQQHFRIALIAMQNNARIITLSKHACHGKRRRPPTAIASRVITLPISPASTVAPYMKSNYAARLI